MVFFGTTKISIGKYPYVNVDPYSCIIFKKWMNFYKVVFKNIKQGDLFLQTLLMIQIYIWLFCIATTSYSPGMVLAPPLDSDVNLDPYSFHIHVYFSKNGLCLHSMPKHIKWGWSYSPTLIHNPHLHFKILYWMYYTLIWNIFDIRNGFRGKFGPIIMYNFPKVDNFLQSCVRQKQFSSVLSGTPGTS